MNCDEFAQRMHERLDQRHSLEGDCELCAHARQCESCSAQLEAWRQIALIMPSGASLSSHADISGKTSFGKTVPAALALAAAVLIAVVPFWHRSESNLRTAVDSGPIDSGPIDSGQVQKHEVVLAQSTGELDPTVWWRSVQDRDWVGQTMPTVKSVQQGVAPIGRSLMRAVTILTMGAHNQTS